VFDIGAAVSLSGKKFATTEFPVTAAATSSTTISPGITSPDEYVDRGHSPHRDTLPDY
jgi:hypothetical protein